MTTFRVHFASGEKRDIVADTADAATKAGLALKIGPVNKVKVVRG